MDQAQRLHIRDDLRGLIKGDLLFDDLSRTLYSTDASIFQVEPLGVVLPRDEADVQTIVRWAAEHQVALVPRGAGTGLAGESLGTGLILDLSRYFREILEVGPDFVRVQPGVVYRALNAELARQGRRFAPDPAGEECTLGGMLATNASGARAMLHGTTRDHVLSLRVVLDSGDVVRVGRESRWPPAEKRTARLEDIISSVATLLEQNAELIRTRRPRVRFDRCGYQLDEVLRADDLELHRLLVGSEGTLGIFTEATLRTIPLPQGPCVVLLGLRNVEDALRAAQLALPTGPSACELLDQRLLSLARGTSALEVAIPPGVGAVLLVEYEAERAEDAQAAAQSLVSLIQHAERLAAHIQVARDPKEATRLWSLREAAVPSLYGLGGGAQAVPFIEDVAVPPEELPAYLHGVQDVLQRYETTASFLIHAGTGQVHARPFVDLSKEAEADRLWAIAEDVYGLALARGGTICSQHGVGLARTPWVAHQVGRLYPLLRELKAIFDPRHLFNPGKIVGLDPALPARPLRGRSALLANPDANGGAPVTQPRTWHLRWEPDEARRKCAECNGCGHCRTESPLERMCPVFRANPVEAATPRAKANLLGALLHDQTDARLLSSDKVREIANLCINCKMCARECPAHVNIPKLMLEAKAANVAEYGLTRSDWAMSRVETIARFGSRFSRLTNLALANPALRWLLEKLVGISRKRRLPAFSRRPFLTRAWRRGWCKPPTSSRPSVAFFVDVFANYNDPTIGEAAVAVLRHQGLDVYVPPEQVGCGMAMLAYGDVEGAREALQHNLRVFADLARHGWPIVCSEPTAAVMMSIDALDLLDEPDARLVANQVVELTTFLHRLHSEGRLRTDFRPLALSIGHHVPCHVKALGRPPAGPELLSLIPELRLRTIDVNCSGMAGMFGLQAKNYELSLAAGKPMLRELASPVLQYGSTECSTCRVQMEDVVGKRTLHPVQYLALAYGLMPELQQRLTPPRRGLVLS